MTFKTAAACIADRRPTHAPVEGQRRAGGFTLVELMVGLTVGLFVTVIAVTLFVSTRKLQTVDAASNRMSENARLAFDLLHKDLRLAGFRGCTDLYDRTPASALNGVGDDFLVDASGVRGYHGSGGAYTPSLPPALAAAVPAPASTSDVLSVRVPVDAVALSLVTSMTAGTDTPDVGTAAAAANPIASGDVVLMSNCRNAVLFQVTGAGAPAATGLLPHAVGGAAAPGNATLNLGGIYNRADSSVYRVQTRHYYVAPSSARPGTNSLWRLTVPTPVGRPAIEEVVSGIDGLKVSFGLDVSAVGDRAADRYATADAVTDWTQVLSARIQMLAATTDNGTATAASSVQFAGTTVSPGDRRLREVYTELVAFRNQMP